MMSLKPITKLNPPMPRFAVCDIESRDWENFVVIGYYAGDSFEYFDSLEKFFSHIFSLKRPPETVFAHFGGRFDFMFLINFLLASKDYKMLSLIPRGSSILSFEVQQKLILTNDEEATFPENDKWSAPITFRDSSAFLPFSLRSLTNDFNVPVKKGEIDYDKIDKITPDLLSYLESDCIGLYQCICLYFASNIISRSGPAFTTAGQALRIFRTFITEPVVGCPPEIESFIRQGYFGGRTEIFKPLFEGPGEIYCYDVNSLYPYVMAQNDMPGRFSHESDDFEADAIGWVDCTVNVPNQYVPPLPKVIDGKLLFPTGTFRGTFSTAELRQAIDLHGVSIVEVDSAVYFESAGKIFEDYILSLYAHRKRAAKGSVDDITAKLAMNSLYGRFALNKIRENFVFDNNQEGFDATHTFKIGDKTVRLGTQAVQLKTFSHVGIAAWVTSQARIHMLRLFRDHSKTLYYTDTDSIFTTEKIESNGELGGLKLEYSAKRACFLLPKTYVTESDETKKVAMKGFSNRKIQHFGVNDFKNMLEGEIRKNKEIPFLTVEHDDGLATFKTALRRGKVLTKKGKTIKSIRSKYDKRIIVKSSDGTYDSIPLELNQAKTTKKEKP